MTKDYLGLALAALFLFAANSWGQDQQQKNEEALKAAKGSTPTPPKDAKKSTPRPTTEKSTPTPPQDAKTKIPAELQDQNTKEKQAKIVKTPSKEKPDQENGNENSVETHNTILIIILLVLVLALLGCSLFLLKHLKTLHQDNKGLVRVLQQNQTKNSGETSVKAPPSKNEDQLKLDLNDKLEQIAKYMQLVSGSSAEAAASTKETSAFAKQITETIVAKEKELSMLREGYQQSMIGPVVNGFLHLRDNLAALLATDLEAELRKQLENLNQSIEISLSEIGVNELLLEIGSDPLTIESKKWRSLEATRPTSERRLDGAVAGIIKPGYTSVGPQGDEIVIRKAEIVRYKHEG
jgi:outer membrane biosynthesis protein TonB